MYIQVNSDKNISGREALVHSIEATLNHVLARFAGHNYQTGSASE